MIISVEKYGSEIHISGKSEYGYLKSEKYFYCSKKEAIRLFKEKNNLKYERGIKIVSK
ncbi:hypothetical protein ACNSOL_12275 (plasmid) [Aliarcobacter lanthieri]|uniref:hypothetical protein n=1 Tax=Aliarcobacter lanthieri TaxID=1355374 RepID=UPI003AAAECE3